MTPRAAQSVSHPNHFAWLLLTLRLRRSNGGGDGSEPVRWRIWRSGVSMGDPSRVAGTEIGTDNEADVDAENERVASGPASGEPCTRCGNELSVIRILVDGNTLLMESCDGCDARRWQLAGERIELQEALSQVGEHAGRRR